MVEKAVENKVEAGEWYSIKIKADLYNKIKKVADEKKISMNDAIEVLQLTLYANFPHQGNLVELFKCDECRPNVINAIKKAGYWPEPKEVIKEIPKEVIKEVIKIVEVPVAKVETGSIKIKHLGYETPKKHL